MKIGKKIDLIGYITKISPKITIIIIVFILMVTPIHSQTFKSSQLKYQRVRQAYDDSYESMDVLFQNKGVDLKNMKVFIRALKYEKKLEVFAKNLSDTSFVLIKTYDFCTFSGELGPKRERGDMQIPEGFYFIDRFNPTSYFFLSLGINYPNQSDKKLSDAHDLGGDIFMHGDCVSVGCIPITDEGIKELYIICTEAKNSGQTKIPVHFFPFKMGDYKKNRAHYSTNIELLLFWDSLVAGYTFFEEKRQLPTLLIDESGKYVVSKNIP